MASAAFASPPLSLAGSRGRVRTAVRQHAQWWARTISGLVLVVWLVPIKNYTLPVQLPFNLEPYRLLIILIGFVWLVGAMIGRTRFSTAGHGAPLAAIVAVAVVALIANRAGIVQAGLETQAVKSFSFFLSYGIAFVLVTSTLERIREVERVVVALAAGAVAVSVAALVESRTHYNVFQHLHEVVPFLDHIGKERTNFAGGHLRVRASAQHPIALGAALAISIPIVLYAASRARTRMRRRLWLCSTAVIAMGALATESRTVVLTLIAMLVTAFRLWGRKLLRYWPLLLVLFAVTHVAAPGVVSHLWMRFNPKGGMIQQQQVRPGMRGSGRIADVGPGLARWSGAPLFGHGLGTTAATGDQSSDLPGMTVIYDDQYMNTLVSLGAVGLASVVWFVWGAGIKVTRAARRALREGRPEAELLAACALSCAGFAAAMLTFDAFSFVQVTLLFFIVAALGLRARADTAR